MVSLDAVGNTTKAVTKGFAIGSAVIASVALFASMAGAVLSGTVLVETTFALPGLGQSMVVENIAGASGTIGAYQVTRAAPDGYTLLANSISMAFNDTLYSKLPYDSIKDFSPVSLLAISANVLTVGPSSSAKTVQDLVQLAKSRPGKLNYGSGGIGGSDHVCSEYFQSVTGTKLVNVSYRGSAPALADLAAGMIEMAFAPIASGMPLITSGKLRALGVSTTQRLLDVKPDDFDFIFDTNVRGAFFVAQEVGKRMVARARGTAPGTFTGGRIINIASMAGLKVLPQIGAYCMSKSAVIQMTKAMALEWGRFGINVNAICPGYIDTEINHHHWETEQGQKLINMLPRKRVGQPKDLDALLVMLASDESGFINGAIVAADDGFAL